VRAWLRRRLQQRRTRTCRSKARRPDEARTPSGSRKARRRLTSGHSTAALLSRASVARLDERREPAREEVARTERSHASGAERETESARHLLVGEG